MRLRAVPTGDHIVPIGKADIKRAGTDATIVTYGRGVFDSLKAAELLASEGIDAEVLDLRTLLPLDTETILESVGRTGRAIITHHAVEFAGPGAEVAAQINSNLFGRLRAPVERVGTRFRSIPSSTLESEVLPSPDKIAAAVRKTLEYGK